jgi:hypothetical protein
MRPEASAPRRLTAKIRRRYRFYVRAAPVSLGRFLRQKLWVAFCYGLFFSFEIAAFLSFVFLL